MGKKQGKWCFEAFKCGQFIGGGARELERNEGAAMLFEAEDVEIVRTCISGGRSEPFCYGRQATEALLEDCWFVCIEAVDVIVVINFEAFWVYKARSG